jgi:predicted esterase
MTHPHKRSQYSFRLLMFFFVCFAVLAQEKAAPPPGLQVKWLAVPQAVLQPPVDFLAEEPVIDGRLDERLQALPRRSFAFQIKMNPAAPDTTADYRLAYGTSFLYLFIDVQADQLICRDRGYQNGDGFILFLTRPRPEGRPADESYLLGYHPTGNPGRPFAQMVWKRNDAWPFSPLGERSSFHVLAEKGRIGFEALLPWEEVQPYHPWLSEGLGFNLALAKAYGQSEVNYLAVILSPSAGPQVFEAYSRLAFAPPSLAAGIQSAVVLERNHLTAGQQLRVKIAAVSAAPGREQLNFSLWSGEGLRLLSQAVSVDLNQGLSVGEAVLDTSGLATGGYMVRWESRENKSAGRAGLTVLPPFDRGARKKELNDTGSQISAGSAHTIRFLLTEISRDLSRLKPTDTCPVLRAKMEHVDRLLDSAGRGDDVLARQKVFLRRAFQSQLDNSLQPYTVFVPESLEAGKKYPALVFLHGSDSDDQSVIKTRLAYPLLFPEQMFIVAPYGRGPSNAYTRDHAQDDIREAVADALRHYPIDPSRLVLAGFSMGGYGVYRTLYENPKMYTAAAVFSGHPAMAGQYAPGGSHPDFRRPEFREPWQGLNIAVIHGGRDRNCPLELTVELVEAMKGEGIPVHFFLDQEAGHEMPRDPAVQQAYLNWLKAALGNPSGPPHESSQREPSEVPLASRIR